MLMGGEQGSTWKPNEKRESLLVFIGKELPRKAIEKGLEMCLV
jgi:G3E family GTPase